MQTSLTSRVGFCGPRVAARPTTTLRASRTPVVKVAAASGYQWLNKNPLALVLGVVGWTLPASIGVPAFGGNSLFGAFTASISSELAHFPTGPALTDEFWLLLVSYHIGLFLALTLAQIGVEGRKQEYW